MVYEFIMEVSLSEWGLDSDATVPADYRMTTAGSGMIRLCAHIFLNLTCKSIDFGAFCQ